MSKSPAYEPMENEDSTSDEPMSPAHPQDHEEEEDEDLMQFSDDDLMQFSEDEQDNTQYDDDDDDDDEEPPSPPPRFCYYANTPPPPPLFEIEDIDDEVSVRVYLPNDQCSEPHL
jgi:hypothetical protein